MILDTVEDDGLTEEESLAETKIDLKTLGAFDPASIIFDTDPDEEVMALMAERSARGQNHNNPLSP